MMGWDFPMVPGFVVGYAMHGQRQEHDGGAGGQKRRPLPRHLSPMSPMVNPRTKPTRISAG